MGPIQMPEGAALPLQAGSKLVAQVHYHPDGKPEEDQFSAGFYFTDQPPVRRVVDVGLSSSADRYSGRRSTLRGARALHHPHRHRCRRHDSSRSSGLPRNARLGHPSRTARKQWLLNIRDWDFNWQDQFQYARPIRLPADTRIEMEFVYDNSTANPRNPHSPPQRVVWGPGTGDEMAGLHVQSIPVHMDELPELGKALWGAVMRSVGGSFYRLPPAQ